MNFLKRTLVPVELVIESKEKLNEVNVKIDFSVVFQIGYLFNLKRMRVKTHGTLVTDLPLDKKGLLELILLTDLDKFFDLNFERSRNQKFKYNYIYQGNHIQVIYDQFKR